MEPMAPMGASLTAVAVDGGGGNGIVPAAVDNNNDTMALAALASLTNGSSSAAAMAIIVIDCVAAVDATATILLSVLTAVQRRHRSHCHQPSLQSITGAMAVI